MDQWDPVLLRAGVGQVRECTGPAMQQHTYTQRAHNTHSPARLPLPLGRHPGLLPFGNSAFGTLQHSTAQHSAAQHSTAQRSAAQHSTAQRSPAQHSTAQHNTAQHSTAQHGTARHGTAPHRAAQHCTALHRTRLRLKGGGVRGVLRHPPTQD